MLWQLSRPLYEPPLGTKHHLNLASGLCLEDPGICADRHIHRIRSTVDQRRCQARWLTTLGLSTLLAEEAWRST